MEAQEPSKDYIEGFNKGYVLREHKPDLALSLSQTKFPKTEQEYSNGFKDGIKQKEMELIKARYKNNTKDRDHDLER